MTSTEAHIAPQPPDLDGWSDVPRRGRGFSLRTLIVLRWLTILGQSAAILTEARSLADTYPRSRAALQAAMPDTSAKA